MAHATVADERCPPEESAASPDAKAESDVLAIREPRLRTTERIESYDWIRLIAAVNVIIYHVTTPPDGLIGRGGVASFLMIAGSLPAMRADLGPFGQFARRRAKRILVPWLCWSSFYGAIAGVRYLHHGIEPKWPINYVFVGTSLHLWFFPAVYVGALLTWVLVRATNTWSTDRKALCIATAGAALLSGYAFTISGVPLAPPYGQWLYSIPALTIGVGLGLGGRARFQRTGRLLIVAISAITIFAAVVNLAYGQPRDGFSYGIAGLFVPAALLLPIRSGPVLRKFSDVSMGVYASHPFVYLALLSIVGDRQLPVWILAALVGIGAIGFSGMLRRVPFARAMV